MRLPGGGLASLKPGGFQYRLMLWNVARVSPSAATIGVFADAYSVIAYATVSLGRSIGKPVFSFELKFLVVPVALLATWPSRQPKFCAGSAAKACTPAVTSMLSQHASTNGAE